MKTEKLFLTTNSQHDNESHIWNDDEKDKKCLTDQLCNVTMCQSLEKMTAIKYITNERQWYTEGHTIHEFSLKK